MAIPFTGRSLGGGRDHCFVCEFTIVMARCNFRFIAGGKAVYINDQQFRVDGEVYHQHCFKCGACDVQLNLSSAHQRAVEMLV